MNIEEISKRVSYDPITGKLHRIKDKHGEGIKREITTIANNGYIYFSFDRKVYLAHRFAWFSCFGGDISKQIDHINGNRLDNRLGNLRLVSATENNKNLKLNSKSSTGIMGVHFHPSNNKWRVSIHNNSKKVELGYHFSFLDACCARKSAEVKYGYHENHGRAV